MISCSPLIVRQSNGSICGSRSAYSSARSWRISSLESGKGSPPLLCSIRNALRASAST
jgi:hypothetical protein